MYVKKLANILQKKSLTRRTCVQKAKTYFASLRDCVYVKTRWDV